MAEADLEGNQYTLLSPNVASAHPAFEAQPPSIVTIPAGASFHWELIHQSDLPHCFPVEKPTQEMLVLQDADNETFLLHSGMERNENVVQYMIPLVFQEP